MGPEDLLTPRERRAAALDLTRQALAGLAQGAIRVSTETRSMAPLLDGGELLRWKRPVHPPRRGELVIFLQKPGPVVHRVIGRRGTALRTKGDGRAAPDQNPVRPDEVLGRVEQFETRGCRYSLLSPGARLYAAAALTISWTGAGLHAVAAAGDAVLRRMLPGRQDRRFFRAPAWWLQRMTQSALHAALFRACHRPLPAEDTR